MTDAPWTPGPWTLYAPSPKNVMLTANGFHIGSIAMGGPVDILHDRANARLIAEAPAMAEALELLAGFAEKASTLDWNEDRNVMWAAVMAEKTRAILARINGGTP